MKELQMGISIRSMIEVSRPIIGGGLKSKDQGHIQTCGGVQLQETTACSTKGHTTWLIPTYCHHQQIILPQ